MRLRPEAVKAVWRPNRRKIDMAAGFERRGSMDWVWVSESIENEDMTTNQH